MCLFCKTNEKNCSDVQIKQKKAKFVFRGGSIRKVVMKE